MNKITFRYVDIITVKKSNVSLLNNVVVVLALKPISLPLNPSTFPQCLLLAPMERLIPTTELF